MPSAQANQASVCVKPPSLGTWDTLECKACRNGQCLQGKKCYVVAPQRRLLGEEGPLCDGSIQCDFENLESTTTYT